MRELSLFSGAGGGLLGTKYFLEWSTVGYVEFNDYCQRVIRQRIDDGLLDNAPIYGDIRAFLGEGYADAYQGLVDVITAGFPCQPFSTSGKQLSGEDPRNMWPSTKDAIGCVRPKFVFLENVAGLPSTGYDRTIIKDLASLGYVGQRTHLSGLPFGAPDKRDRVWFIAVDANAPEGSIQNTNRNGVLCQQAADSRHDGHDRAMVSPQMFRKAWHNQEVQIESNFLGMANRFPSEVDRIKAIGNSQRPIVAATAWNLLTSA